MIHNSLAYFKKGEIFRGETLEALKMQAHGLPEPITGAEVPKLLTSNPRQNIQCNRNFSPGTIIALCILEDKWDGNKSVPFPFQRLNVAPVGVGGFHRVPGLLAETGCAEARERGSRRHGDLWP